ncbi:hypothetical protein IFM89_013934 [Coptis chinensis]|uniref:tRNA-uridine aminocarboxypropyltransferase n=1 Tax=Coptis chinensis TaxID=261450 RepID=A0A835HCT6_9MAGN|nr:hypothetical protein IFM89_013934 [Coptis chinensis]
MDPESESESEPQLTQFEFEEQPNQNKPRQICSKGCARPANVCLCNVLPKQPIFTSTKLVILHHPHEHRHKLATVPILTKCLTNCQIKIGRRLRSASFSFLDSLYNASVMDPLLPHHAVFLFPGEVDMVKHGVVMSGKHGVAYVVGGTDGVVVVARAFGASGMWCTESSPSVELNQWVSANRDKIDINNLVLIVFDGTWKHAKEMVSASLPFLSKFASQVCLNYDVAVDGETIFDSELVLRKEPFSGCMSTIEVVARSLRVLESNGIEIEEVLISVLRAMVHFQACHLKPVKPRPKLMKKGKEANELKSQIYE